MADHAPSKGKLRVSSRRKIQCSSLYPCIMHTIKYQSHLEQNFAHYTQEITAVFHL